MAPCAKRSRTFAPEIAQIPSSLGEQKRSQPASGESISQMNRTALSFACCVLLMGFAGQQIRGPERQARDTKYPATIPTAMNWMNASAANDWVAASALVDSSGNFREELLFEGVPEPNYRGYKAYLVDAFEEARAAERTGADPPPCLVLDYGIAKLTAGGAEQATSMDRLVSGMPFAFSGTVVSHEGGFAHGQPVTVLEIEVKEWLRKPSAAVVAASNYNGPRPDETNTGFVLYPAGNFDIGPLEVCFASDGMPPVPAVGDQFVMLTHADYPIRVEPEGWPFLDLRSDGWEMHGAGNEPPLMSSTLRRRIGALDAAPSLEAAIEALRYEIREDDARRRIRQ